MVKTFFDFLPFAVGIAISPVPIITVILILFSSRARWNGSAFLLGWALGIGIPGIVVMMFMVSSKNVVVASPTKLASGIRILMGAILLFAAVHRWKKRPKADKETSIPKWMLVIDSISPLKALIIGFLFADVTNPKNMALTIAACVTITNAALSQVLSVAMVTAFVIISSAGVAIPVILYLAGGESAKLTLDAWKVWLMRNNHAVMAILFLVFGLILLSEGIQGLIG
jgi:threonine/homoserine/homoserine lactone efflux protein